MKQATTATTNQVEWANPGALGLAAFGFNTILLQIHNIGLTTSSMPLIWGFFWGGLAQVIAGIIDARRGDTFGLTAFTSYGLFWIGLSFSFLLNWLGIATVENEGYAWTFICWGVFTGFMSIGTFKMTVMHAVVFITLTVLFFLLAAVFFGAISAKVAGWEGLVCGLAAAYGAAGVVLNNKYGRTIIPLGQLSK
jgi:uncharacterized protein